MFHLHRAYSLARCCVNPNVKIPLSTGKSFENRTYHTSTTLAGAAITCRRSVLPVRPQERVHRCQEHTFWPGTQPTARSRWHYTSTFQLPSAANRDAYAMSSAHLHSKVPVVVVFTSALYAR